MAATSTEICNLALSHLGVGQSIENVETERSPAARACRTFYDQARDSVLRDFSWPFATKFADLALVESAPTTEWGYAYRMPSDCLKVRRILSGMRTDTRASRVSLRVTHDASGKLILTDSDAPVLEYTARVTDPTLYSPDFVAALSLRLAAYIAPRVTGGDPFKNGERAMRMYQIELGLAETSALGEEQPDVEPESEFIRGRE